MTSAIDSLPVLDFKARRRSADQARTRRLVRRLAVEVRTVGDGERVTAIAAEGAEYVQELGMILADVLHEKEETQEAEDAYDEIFG